MRNATQLTSPLVAPPAAVLRSPCASGRLVVTFALRTVARDTEMCWGMRVWLVEVLSVPLTTWNLFLAVRQSARRQQCVVVRAAQVDTSAFFRCLNAFSCCMRATSLSHNRQLLCTVIENLHACPHSLSSCITVLRCDTTGFCSAMVLPTRTAAR